MSAAPRARTRAWRGAAHILPPSCQTAAQPRRGEGQQRRSLSAATMRALRQARPRDRGRSRSSRIEVEAAAPHKWIAKPLTAHCQRLHATWSLVYCRRARPAPPSTPRRRPRFSRPHLAHAAERRRGAQRLLSVHRRRHELRVAAVLGNFVLSSTPAGDFKCARPTGGPRSGRRRRAVSVHGQLHARGSLRVDGKLNYLGLSQWFLARAESFEASCSAWSNCTRTSCGAIRMLGGYGAFAGGEVPPSPANSGAIRRNSLTPRATTAPRCRSSSCASTRRTPNCG